MNNSWRLLGWAAAVCLWSAADATAQTVMIRHVPPGSPIEAVVNRGTAVTGTAGAEGDGTVVLPALDAAGKGELDANVFLDTCGAVHRVVIADHDKPAPQPADGCDRKDISGVFWVRRINTIVVDAAGVTPTLLLIKGSYTAPAPVSPDALNVDDEEVKKPRKPSPVGPTVFGAAGEGNYANAGALQCGNTSPCTSRDSGLNYSFGLNFWLKDYLAIEGSYLKPRTFTANGGDTFTFKTTIPTDMWTVAGLIAIPINRVRIYGRAGANFSQSTTTTNETIDLASQTVTLKTRGWGYLFGGGLEVWVTNAKRIAVFGDVDFAKINGKPIAGGEASFEDTYTTVLTGVRLRVGRGGGS